MARAADCRAWGAARERAAAVAQPLRFQGQYADAETGLHYTRHRYYSPAEGRFVHQDPIRLAGGDNVAAYAPNPVHWTDPLGLTTCGFDGAGRPLESDEYSVAYEAKLEPGTHFPGRSARSHFQESNRQLHNAMRDNPDFASAMEAQYPGTSRGVAPGARGAHSGEAPLRGENGLTWHHHPPRPGVMQLVPRAQHQAPGPVQGSLHPNQQGGMELWGGGR